VRRAIETAKRWIPWWFSAGLWLGILSGYLGLRLAPPLAGSWPDRFGTTLVSMATYALLLTLAAAVLAPVTGLLLAKLGRGSRPSGSSSGPRRSWILAAPGVAAIVTAVGWGAPSTGPRAEHPNIILVSIDTLRADHLSGYGYERPTSPNLDELGRGGVVFERTYAQASWTLPSHASMLTGLDPIVHGVVETDQGLEPEHVMLAERLQEAGYRSAGIVAGKRFFFLGAARGFDQGFDLYVHYPHPGRFRGGLLTRRLDHVWLKFVERGLGQAQPQVDQAIHWIRHDPQRPFFLFLHLLEVHSNPEGTIPYGAPRPFQTRFCPGGLGDYDGCGPSGKCSDDRLKELDAGAPAEPDEVSRMICLYDGAIAYADDQLGRLFRALDDVGVSDRTLVAVTSDHGEGFLEHGKTLHHTVYDEVIRVPLILRGPGVPVGARIAAPVRLIDLVPTLLDLAKIPSQGPMQGRSLVPLMRSQPGAETDVAVLSVGPENERRVALIEHGWKYIVDEPGSPEELFGVETDPGESENLADRASSTEILATLRRKLGEQLSTSEELRRQIFGEAEATTVEIPEDEKAGLRALGYVVE
jgi:arylsulfatase A-like enzyme